jgi:hypothetical protein
MSNRHDRHSLATAALVDPVHIGVAGHGGVAAVVALDDQFTGVVAADDAGDAADGAEQVAGRVNEGGLVLAKLS